METGVNSPPEKWEQQQSGWIFRLRGSCWVLLWSVEKNKSSWAVTGKLNGRDEKLKFSEVAVKWEVPNNGLLLNKTLNDNSLSSFSVPSTDWPSIWETASKLHKEKLLPSKVETPPVSLKIQKFADTSHLYTVPWIFCSHLFTWKLCGFCKFCVAPQHVVLGSTNWPFQQVSCSYLSYGDILPRTELQGGRNVFKTQRGF